MVFVNPIFNIDINRPYRWYLQYVDSGDIMDGVWLADTKYVHWTVKPTAVKRKVFTDVSPYTVGNLTPMRKRRLGFLTTHHTNMYEDGKYTEVYNDPINYIFDTDDTNTGAYLTAEARIGNYRSGVRRHITHLGGTISEDELDMLDDSANPPVALSSFPLFPPLPTTDFGLPFRTKLLTSDVGYIDYVKAAHPGETTATDKYAYRAEQGTGFRRIVWDAGNTNIAYRSTNAAPSATDPIISVPKVELKDIETVADAHIANQITGTAAFATPEKTLLPLDGEDVLINIPGWHVVRSDELGYTIEMYDAATLTTLISSIAIESSTGTVQVASGNSNITMLKDGTITIDTSVSNSNIVLNAGTGDVTMAVGDLNITGGLIVSGATDLNSTLNVSGVTTHGG